MPQVKYLDFTPYSPGDPVSGVRLCEINGALFTTTDGVTFTAIGGGGGGGGSSDIVASVVSVANLSLTGAATVDGVALSTGQVCLAAGQTDHTQNGPYTVNTAGAWTRVTAFATAAQMIPGLGVRVLGGSPGNAGSLWVFTTTSAITVGTTALTFVEVPGSGALAGLTLAQSRLTMHPEYFTQVAGASIQTMTLSGLDGNTDGDYDVFGQIVGGHAGAIWDFRPNGNTANLLQAIGDGIHGTAFGAKWIAIGWTGFYNAGTIGVGETLTFSGVLSIRTGLPWLLAYTGYINGAVPNIIIFNGQCTATATNLTSLALASNQTDGLAAGSFLRLRARGVS